MKLRDKAESIRREKDEKIKDITSKHDTLVEWIKSDRLHNDSKTSFTDSDSNTRNTEVREDSNRLFGYVYTKDALDLAAFAKQSDITRAELQACYFTYESVEKTLEELRKRYPLAPKK